MAPTRRPVEERLVAKVEKRDDGCWIWTGATNGKAGYGHIRIDQTRTELVHRVSYKAFVGPIPPDMQIDHRCGVKLCCNPEHLDLVTRQENVARIAPFRRHNALKTHCKRGHAFTPENTYLTTDGRRTCRICHREAVDRWKATNADLVRKRDREAKARKRREIAGSRPSLD